MTYRFVRLMVLNDLLIDVLVDDQRFDGVVRGFMMRRISLAVVC